MLRWGLLLTLLARLIALSQPIPVRAQAGSASDLIAAVNAYRAENGLEPYGGDGSLMSEAQSQAEYMASIETCTHDRADGSQPGDHGVSAENVACGLNLSVDGAIYGQWTDALHSATILGPDTGLAGAGVATQGDMVYYVLDVKRLSGDFTYRAPKTTDAPTPLPGTGTATPNPQRDSAGPLSTSTLAEDGSLRHTVRYGETLVQIAEAYGISLAQLYAFNPSLDATKPVYYEGEVVLIRPANTATPTPTETATPRPPTRTPTATRTPTRVVTATPTATSTQAPLVDLSGLNTNRHTVGLVVVIVCGLGALLVVASGLGKKGPSKEE